jgi:hypothetical protein
MIDACAIALIAPPDAPERMKRGGGFSRGAIPK